jgi:hypothetical protein
MGDALEAAARKLPPPLLEAAPEREFADAVGPVATAPAAPSFRRIVPAREAAIAPPLTPRLGRKR